jgi:hypothetical protein
MNKKVVSFSLWGSHPAYCVGAIENAKLIGKKLYKDWESWFYLGNNVPQKYICELDKFASKIIFVNRCDFSLAFERFSSIFNPDVKISVSRDADSRVSDKEYQAVLEWENCDLPLHSMVDHELHHWPVMAGMWGVKNSLSQEAFFDLNNLYRSKNPKFKTDQMFLKIFHDRYKDLFLSHGSNERIKENEYPAYSPFEYGSYIGQRIDENNNISSDINGFSGEGY